MTDTKKAVHSWQESIKALVHPKVLAMLFLGFSAGLPLLLIFSSLSLWLREAGVERSEVTFFSWAALGYSFKFVWAPLIDRLPLPVLTRLLGRRRGWLLLSQIAVAASICAMGMIDPARGGMYLTLMACAAVMLGFCSATQDIVIDAFRIESAAKEYQALMASTYVAGYRVAMILAGAGSLFLADGFGSMDGAYNYHAWQWTYLIMALSMGVGVATTLMIREPEHRPLASAMQDTSDYLRFLLLFILCATGFILTFFFSNDVVVSLKAQMKAPWADSPVIALVLEASRLGAGVLAAFIVAQIATGIGVADRAVIRETYVDPIADFFNRYGNNVALLILALVGLYRISDIVLGVISNVFYQDLKFSKTEIAAVSKFFGVVMTIVGGFIGGVLSIRMGVIRILFLGALLSAATNLLFMFLAKTGYDMTMLCVVISADSLAGGLASTAFVAFLSSLTDIRFTAMQYALFSSLMSLIPKITGGYSGTIVDSLGYPAFFLMTAVMGIPVLVLIWLADRYVNLDEKRG